jgi:hypothetical protein
MPARYEQEWRPYRIFTGCGIVNLTVTMRPGCDSVNFLRSGGRLLSPTVQKTWADYQRQ